jgi:hypothetical protein
MTTAQAESAVPTSPASEIGHRRLLVIAVQNVVCCCASTSIPRTTWRPGASGWSCPPTRGLVTWADGAVEARPSEGVPGATGVPGGPPAGVDGPVRLTASGQAAAERLVTARHDAVADLVQDWNPEQHAELAALLQKLARYLAEGPPPVTAEPALAGAGVAGPAGGSEASQR